MRKLYVYSGPVKSGKTSELISWVAKLNSAEGILQPVINGRRWIRDVNTGETKLLEAFTSSPSDKVVQIGDYSFFKDTLNWAREVVDQGFKDNPEWLIIDEVGKLEMEDEGLEPVISKIINSKKRTSTNVLFVVRDSLLKEFQKKYKLTESDFDSFQFNQ
jgi:nucleoside-triphosphatase THEP1